MEPPVKSPFESEGGASSGKAAPEQEEPAQQPEEEELPLLKSPMVTKAPFILVNEFCERLAYYSIATNIIVRGKASGFGIILHGWDLTNELGQSNSSAAASVNAWSGTCYVTPLLGAFLADAYFGRFWVIFAFSLIYMLGLAGLAASAGDSSLHPADGQAATSSQLAFFWAFMYLVAVGTGGIKPCVSTFGADQFDDSKPQERRLIPRFFNWFYAAINVGAILSATVVVNVQEKVSWFAGFLIPCISFAVAICVFLLGSVVAGYRRVPPGGSPLTRMFRVLCGTCAHRKAAVPDKEGELHEVEGDMSCIPGQAKLGRTASYKWLEKACTVAKPVGAPDKWLVTLTEVEETKCVVRLIPVMLTLIVYNAIYAQMTTLFVLQGEGMDTSLGGTTVAPATVSVLDSISVIVWVVLYDMVIAPFFARRGRPISLLVRIGIGYCIAILAMVAAAIVEIVRLNVVASHGLQDDNPTDAGSPTVPMSVWWQIPQYALIGASEVFAMIGSLEMFYSQAPDAMRSTCAALQLVATALGSYLAAALVAIVQAISNGTWVADNVNQGHMDYFFWLLAVLMALTLIVYVFIARRFRYRTVEHHTFDPEAMALAPDGRGALTFSPSFVRKISKDIDQGMHRQDSVELQQRLSLTIATSRRRSSAAVVALAAVSEEPAAAGAPTGAAAVAAGDVAQAP